MKDENEEYPFLEEKEKINEEFNPKCRCPKLNCPRHSNCKECKAFHNKNLELTYCEK
jgi:hypothetical protein